MNVFEIVDLIVQLQTKKETKLKAIQSDHGREFKKSKLTNFCLKHGIKHTFFSAAITPQ